MKKEHLILFFMIVLCIVTIPFTTLAQQQAPQNRKRLVEDQEKKIVVKEDKPITTCGYERAIRVAGFVSNPPFSWVEMMGEGQQSHLETFGYSYNVFKKIAKKLKLKYVSTGYTSYEDAIGALKRGEIDVLLSTYLPEGLGFGVTPVYTAYFKNSFTVYFREDKKRDFASIDDLKKFKGIIRREENIYKLFLNKKALSGLDLEQVKTAKIAFEMLLDGDADYLIGSPYSVESELRRYKLQKKIVSAKVSILDASLFFVLSSNTDCVKLAKILSEEVVAYTHEGSSRDEVMKVVDDWGERFRYDEGLLPEEKPEENDDWMDPNW